MTDMATDIAVAAAVLAEISAAPGGTFNLAFTAERIYLGTPDLASLTGVRVSVVPSEVDDTFLDRSKVQDEVKVNIGIRAKLQNSLPTFEADMTPAQQAAYAAALAAYTAELDALRLLTHKIKRYFEDAARRRLAAMQTAMLARAAENKPVYVQEHLAEYGQYTSIVTLTYKVVA